MPRKGVEAQTLANVYLAIENDLEIIPVLNKIDLPGADPDRVITEIEDVVGLDCSDAIFASAKEGIGIDEILEAIVERIPAPKDTVEEPLQALIFDSYYDPYRGVIVYFRVMSGTLNAKSKIRFMASGREFELDELGVLSPEQVAVDSLHAGEVGYLSAAIKTVEDARVGDTITLAAAQAPEPLPGYVEAKPMVFCGLFPTNTEQFPELREALDKLKLNDAALQYEPETSGAMGFGFRCGFLGLLHMEIVQERLEREYNLDLIVTAPSVIYKVTLNDETVIDVDNPTELPAPNERLKIEEPIVRVELIVPEEFVGAMMELCETRRGNFKDMKYMAQGRTTLIYDLPLAEVVTDFFDQMKSRSRGYASMDYQLTGYNEDKLVRLDVLINSEIVDALSCIVHIDKAYYVGKALVSKLRELIPRHQFVVPIQAAIGSKIVARETIPALRKNVLAKCYGGDISRKRKLLEKQKEGKKRMKSVGTVDVPQSAFMAILQIGESK